MVKKTSSHKDPEVAGALKALRRATPQRQISIEKGTPFYVMKKGKIVDLNAGRKKSK